jgi:hypothetical protein
VREFCATARLEFFCQKPIWHAENEENILKNFWIRNSREFRATDSRICRAAVAHKKKPQALAPEALFI